MPHTSKPSLTFSLPERPQTPESPALSTFSTLSLGSSSEDSTLPPPKLHSNRSSFSSLSSLSHSLLPHRHSKDLLPTLTTSSIASTSTTSSKHKPHKHHNPHHHHSHKAPPPLTPVALAEMALTALLTTPGPSCEELRTEILPEFYHEGYAHRVNTREVGMDGLCEVIGMFRRKFKTVRVRFKSNLMDQDGTATLERAAVALVYDIIAVPITAHKHEAEERRVNCIGVVKIFDGKLAQSDIVVDTTPFHMDDGKELSCVVM
ncbi:hypothetical protein P7C70_g8327, partial [Phenoliferia sp. Uapishka_3]